ncbi:RNA polymerase factor sigma-54 [Frigidibacter oleivorans]|uniref:RNA polymerase factor sigma-54 n=1 Tax=Frigidibacter oleivorans TaxID=2487129 RepID=UPI000F8F2531|nr:RNA polymerase factor sigma-54 [Frigidibacter oleivorans]
MQLSFQQTVSHRQSIVVSQQLRQAIVILQMCNAELESFIESQVEENPFLDLRPAPQPGASAAPATGPAAASRGEEDWDRIAALPGAAASLWGHVAQQIAALGLSPDDLTLASAFLDALAPSGWIDAPLAEIAAAAGATGGEALAMLDRLQGLEPAGIFARDLAECLALQLKAAGELSAPFPAMLRNLPLVAAADLRALARACDCGIDELRPALRRLRELDPKPGAAFDTVRDPVRPPDLVISDAAGGGWLVELNRSTLPGVVVRRDEARRMAPVLGKTGHGAYLSDRLAHARWLARAVDHRNRTLRTIGETLARLQDDFLRLGPDHLRPMTMKEVALASDVHESTVSRIAAGILVATPQGCLPLRRFFTAALPARDTAPGSAGAVRHRIGRLIRDEPVDAPLSDDQLVGLMRAEGVDVARRTVAKYRTQLNLPASKQRHRQAVLAGRA